MPAEDSPNGSLPGWKLQGLPRLQSTSRNSSSNMPDDAPEELRVKRGTAETTTLDYAAPERLLVPKGEGRDLQTKILLPDTLQAPVRQGSPVGSWQLLRGETVLQELPICAAQDVQALSFGYCLRYLVHTVLLGGA